jgi:hypothetical protein
VTGGSSTCATTGAPLRAGDPALSTALLLAPPLFVSNGRTTRTSALRRAARPSYGFSGGFTTSREHRRRAGLA